MRPVIVLLRSALLLLALAALLSFLSAQVVSSKGSATLIYGPPECGTPKGVGKNKQPLPACLAPTQADIQQVQRNAALSAIETYVAGGTEAGLQAFDKIKESVQGQYANIVLNLVELNRTVDSTSRQLTMLVRVDINEARLRSMMQANSAIGQKGGGAKSLMGSFMMAREQATVENFNAEVRKTATATSSTSSAGTRDTARAVTEKESIKGGTVTLNDKVKASGSAKQEESATQSLVEGGSTVRRAEEIQYRVHAAQDLDGVLSGRLSGAGFEMVEAAFLEDDARPALMDVVRNDFGSGDDLRAATVRRMLLAAQKQDVKYALVGTVDLEAPMLDDVSGLQRVYAKVNAKVYDLSGRLPRTVVNVAPAQYAGLGPSASVAKVNALKAAGEAVAREVLAQLNVKEVR